MKAPTTLTVIIRSISLSKEEDKPLKLRVIQIELSDDQRRKLILEEVEQEVTEEISQAILG